MADRAPRPMAVNPVRGRRPVLQNCTIAELAVDPAYQRAIDNAPSQALIRAIARDWDWSLCQPLVVAARPGEGLFVVDGQHRLAAARLRGDILDLPCVITSHAGPAEEAAAFVALNRRRRALGALDLFRAAIAGGDEDSRMMMAMIAEAGLSLAPHSNMRTWKPGQISHVAGIQRAFRTHGEAVTRRSLFTLARAFDGEVLRYGGTIFGGLWPVIGERPGRIDDDLLVMVLQGQSQADWNRDFAGVEAGEGIHRARAAARVLRAAYDEAAGDEAQAA